MKIPITVPKVFAAFFSFANFESFREIPTFGGKLNSCWNADPILREWLVADSPCLFREGDECLNSDRSDLSFPVFAQWQSRLFGPSVLNELSLLIFENKKITTKKYK